jgi:hypothetical protein
MLCIKEKTSMLTLIATKEDCACIFPSFLKSYINVTNFSVPAGENVQI